MSHSPFCGILRSYGFFVYGYFSIAYFQEVVRMEWTFSDSVRLSLLSFSEASKACAALPGFSLFRRSLQPERIEYCRAELLPDCLVGSLAVPDKTHPLHLAFSLAFYLDRGQLILAADEQTLPALQSLLFPEEPLDTSDVFHLFFSFLESLIQEDMLYLQNFEKRLATIEESLLDTLPKELQRTLITIRRELLVFHAYYQQLLDMRNTLRGRKSLSSPGMRPSVFAPWKPRGPFVRPHPDAAGVRPADPRDAAGADRPASERYDADSDGRLDDLFPAFPDRRLVRHEFYAYA